MTRTSLWYAVALAAALSSSCGGEVRAEGGGGTAGAGGGAGTGVGGHGTGGALDAHVDVSSDSATYPDAPGGAGGAGGTSGTGGSTPCAPGEPGWTANWPTNGFRTQFSSAVVQSMLFAWGGHYTRWDEGESEMTDVHDLASGEWLLRSEGSTSQWAGEVVSHADRLFAVADGADTFGVLDPATWQRTPVPVVRAPSPLATRWPSPASGGSGRRSAQVAP